jgi:hypothetical protein
MEFAILILTLVALSLSTPVCEGFRAVRGGKRGRFAHLHVKWGKKGRSLDQELAEVTNPGSMLDNVGSSSFLGADAQTGGADNIIATVDEDGGSLSAEQAARIKAEISSPFRGLRKFAYIAMGAAGSLGTFTAVPQLLFAVQDGGENIGAALGNLAIDLGGVVGAVLLLDREGNAEANKVALFEDRERKTAAGMVLSKSTLNEREREIGALPVEIIFSESDVNVTRVFKFSDLQQKGGQSVVIVAGNRGYVRDCVLSARLEGTALFNEGNIYLVPVVMDDNELLLHDGADAANNSGKGFGSDSRDNDVAGMLSAPYIGRAAQIQVWRRSLQKEFATAKEQGIEDAYAKGLVLLVSKQGTVLRRGLGLPLWSTVQDDLRTAK